MKIKEKLPPVQFGIRGGLNSSTFSGDTDVFDDYDPSNRTGFKAGIIVDIPMTKHFYFQPGLYYSQKGMKLKNYDTYRGDEEKEANVFANYFEIPLLLSNRFNVTNDVQLQILYGPYAAICPDSERDVTYRFDYGIQAGVGVLLKRHYYIGCSYDYGLYETSPHCDVYSHSSGDVGLYNRNFSINSKHSLNYRW